MAKEKLDAFAEPDLDSPESEPEPSERDAMVRIVAPLHTDKLVVVKDGTNIEITRDPIVVSGFHRAEVRAAAAMHGISLNEEEE